MIQVAGNGTIGNISSGGVVSLNGGDDGISGTVSAYSIGQLDTQGPISGTVTSAHDIGEIVAGGAVTGSISAGGNIPDLAISGNLTGSIHAGGDMTLGFYNVIQGKITGSLSAGGTLSNLGITRDVAMAGSISAGSISNVTIYGNLAGTVQGQTGVGLLVDGNISGSVSNAGGTMQVSADGNITGPISGSAGTVGVSAGENLSGAVNAGGDIGQVTAGGTISGAIAATGGNVGTVSAGLDIQGAISATGTVGSVHANGNISGNVSGSGGVTSVVAGNDITGAVAASGGAVALVQAGEDVTKAISGTSITKVTAGRNISGSSITGGYIGIVAAGEDLTAAVTASAANGPNDALGNPTASIGGVSAGRAIAGNITATNGAIGGVAAGVVASYTSVGWPDQWSVAGSIGGITISGKTGIGPVTANGITGIVSGSTNAGAINGTTITSSSGSIGDIIAASAISATVTANGSIGNVTANNGGLAGSWAATGSIGDVFARADLTANLIAGSSSAPVATSCIGAISVGKNLSGSITAAGSVGQVVAGLISGNLSGVLTATLGSIGSIWSGGDISSPITSHQGSLTVVANGNISGAISSVGGVIGIANLAISSTSISGGNGPVDLLSGTDLTSDITGASDMYLWAGGQIHNTATSSQGTITELAGGNIQSNATANAAVVVGSVNGSINSSSLTAPRAVGFAATGVQNTTTSPSSTGSSNVTANVDSKSAAVTAFASQTTSGGTKYGTSIVVAKSSVTPAPPHVTQGIIGQFFEGFFSNYGQNFNSGEQVFSSTANGVADKVEQVGLSSGIPLVAGTAGYVAERIRTVAKVDSAIIHIVGSPVQTANAIVDSNAQLGARTLINGGSTLGAFWDIANSTINPAKGIGEWLWGVDIHNAQEIDRFSAGGLQHLSIGVATTALSLIPGEASSINVDSAIEGTISFSPGASLPKPILALEDSSGLIFNTGLRDGGNPLLSGSGWNSEIGVETNSGLTVASGAEGNFAQMRILRNIQPGEKIADIIAEAKGITFTTGKEVALVKLASGERVLVTGGTGGIQFGDGVITRIFGHTHPYDLPPTGPSDFDFEALQALGQQRSYIVEHGQLIKFGPK